MNVDFKEYADCLEKIEVLTIVILPDGSYHIPSEKKGKIADVSPEQRERLRDYLLDFCSRLAPAVPAAEPKKARSA